MKLKVINNTNYFLQVTQVSLKHFSYSWCWKQLQGIALDLALLQNNVFFILQYTPSVSKYMFILKINFVSQYLSISSFNAKLIIVLSIIPLYIYYREREKIEWNNKWLRVV